MTVSIKRVIKVQTTYMPFILQNGSDILSYEVTFHKGTPTIAAYRKAISHPRSILVCLYTPEENSDKLNEIVYVMGLEPWCLPEEQVKAYTVDDEDGFELESAANSVEEKVYQYLRELTLLRVEDDKTKNLKVNEKKLLLMTSIKSAIKGE